MALKGASFDYDELRKEVDAEDWAEDFDNRDVLVRSVCLGSMFLITPSGKMYMPFATSNLIDCPSCGGRGETRSRFKRRVVKAKKARTVEMRRAAIKRYGAYCSGGWPKDLLRRLQRLDALIETQCKLCDGCGSHEAAADERWREEVEEELGRVGLCLDMIDDTYYASEYEDKPNDWCDDARVRGLLQATLDANTDKAVLVQNIQELLSLSETRLADMDREVISALEELDTDESKQLRVELQQRVNSQ